MLLVKALVLAVVLFESLLWNGVTHAFAPLERLLSGMRAGRSLNRFLAARYRQQQQLKHISVAFSRSHFSPKQNAPSGIIKRLASAIPIPPVMTAKDSVETSNGSPHSDYEQWVRRLYQTNMFHPVKMGLDNIERLHAAMGRPMDRITVVHIAGTNGKGSVAVKIANTLQLSDSNLKIGLFSSPHVSSFRERMQVNAKLITESKVVELLPKIYELCQENDIPATFFEITTALAFSFFSSQKVDVVVLETGLGGRLDATNVVKAPALSIITSIGLEHTRILGDTIELIALEKGGIIKPNRPVLVGPNVPDNVLRKCAAEKGASNYFTCDDVLGAPSELSSKELEDYDAENARIASAALHLLQQTHPQVVGSIAEDIIRRGTAVRPPCRFEHIQLENGVPVILDVAHNPAAMEYLARKLIATYPGEKFRMVVGMSSDKDLKLCGQTVLEAVAGDSSRIHFVQALHPRAAKLESIRKATESINLTSANYDLEDPSVTKQIHIATEKALQEGEILVVCGSVFLMSEARQALGIDEPRDSPYIAEVAGAGIRHTQEIFGNTTISTNA